MAFSQEQLLQMILNGPGINPTATGIPPTSPVLNQGPSSMVQGLAAPTAAGAAQDERARLMEILGAAPQMAAPDMPDPQSWKGLLQTGLAGLADVLSAGAAAGPGGYRVEPTRAIAGLTALRQRREAIMAANANAKTEAERDVAKTRLEELDKQEYLRQVQEFQSKRDFANTEKEWWKGNAEWFAKQDKAKSDRYSESLKSARDAGVDLSSLTAGQRHDPDYLDNLTAKAVAARNKEKDKRDSDQMTKAQEQAAIRALADDFYRTNMKPTKKMVTKTDPYGGTSTTESTVEEPGITYAEAMQMARDEFYGTHPKVAPKKPAAEPNKITLKSVRDKIGGR